MWPIIRKPETSKPSACGLDVLAAHVGLGAVRSNAD